MRLNNLLIVLFFFTIISCTSDTKLLGRWTNNNNTIDCQFLEGSKYAFVGENLFRGNPSTGSYIFKNDTLYLYAETFSSTPKTKPYLKTKVTFFSDDKIAFGEESLSRKK